jgi:hypothetical protein
MSATYHSYSMTLLVAKQIPRCRSYWDGRSHPKTVIMLCVIVCYNVAVMCQFVIMILCYKINVLMSRSKGKKLNIKS